MANIKYVLIPVCFILAALFLSQEKKKKYVAAVVSKGMASCCFVLFGLLNAGNSALSRLVVIGLALGLIADVMLNLRYVFQKKGQLVFLVGILIFLSGHIVYLAAVLPLCKGWIWCVVIGLALTAALMAWLFTKITAKKAFKIFGVVYIGAIMVLNCVAIANLIASPSAFTGVFAGGALLFLVSDIVLILNTFGKESKFSLRITNISLYYVGQILIALSLLFV